MTTHGRFVYRNRTTVLGADFRSRKCSMDRFRYGSVDREMYTWILLAGSATASALKKRRGDEPKPDPKPDRECENENEDEYEN